jgi:hypothetical protein
VQFGQKGGNPYVLCPDVTPLFHHTNLVGPLNVHNPVCHRICYWQRPQETLWNL